MSDVAEYKIATFKAWLVQHGGYIHPDLFFKPGAYLHPWPSTRRHNGTNH